MHKIKINKKYILFYTLIMLLLIIVNLIYKNNYQWYDKTIIKVTDVQEVLLETTDTNENNYHQTITAVIMNTSQKGEEVTFTNDRSYSGVILEYSLKVNDEIFVNMLNDNINEIVEVKRDSDLIFVLSIFVFLIILIGQNKGLLCLLSLLINIIIFILIFHCRNRDINVFLLFIMGSILSIIMSLLLVSGLNKKSFSAIISSIISLIITMMITFVVIKFKNNDIKYERMDFVYALKDYNYIFYAGLLIGGIGAIMDIGITLSSALSELIQKNRQISNTDLRKSGIAISKDIIGTMINVLFFTNIVASMPYIIVAMRNKMFFIDAIQAYLQLDFIYILVGSIGIIISIPIALNTAIFILRSGDSL